ncbi:MAG: Phosphoglucosamine mutase [Desulfotomaculum sp. 46_296]|nr:MAG: Phosphoglucosamine mutase [Desulfotomaculum sp. 46_296]KUK84903.1 MAG: Phosphoglucosamine mutase [Desulfofundulus kuznetsovii]HAU32429.1 phosphoglucosamine mutase [Desulfotomaculum sp.]
MGVHAGHGVMFGTDGVRGVANRELKPELALSLGRAGAYFLSLKTPGAPLVVGRDTRISGDMLESALITGMCSAGVNVLKAGVLPTPAVACLTRLTGSCGGAVISASHNPVVDNGIKFFGPDGFKLTDAEEEEIERLVAHPDEIPYPVGEQIGACQAMTDACDRYVQFLKDVVPVDLTGLTIAVDCANGAASSVAPRLFAELGAQVVPMFHTPNGVNINESCGSTHPEKLCGTVLSRRAHIGLAFDGDADRLIAVDEKGNLIDGDQIMVICARDLKERGRLSKNTVVVTVMSNLGLHHAMSKAGIEIAETQVGDRWVLEELIRRGAVFGGEQSGHIIFLEDQTTGDGALTALKLLSVIKRKGLPLGELAAQMDRYPQLLKNVAVSDKHCVMSSVLLKEAICDCERRLNGRGRILVRPSGTEQLVRVMVEGKDLEELNVIVDELTGVIRKLVC